MTKLTREELHDMLDALLDTEDKDTGLVDCSRFWVFVAELARERGISEEIEVAAAAMVGEQHNLSDLKGDNAAEKAAFSYWKAHQGAAVFHLLRRISLPGHETILPQHFNPALAEVHFLNTVIGKARFPDPWRYTIGQRTGGASLAFVARRLIVAAVKYREAKEKISEADARRGLLPAGGHPTPAGKRGEGFDRTWWNWVDEAKAEGWIKRAVAAAQEAEPIQPYAANKQQVAEWWDAAAPGLWK